MCLVYVERSKTSTCMIFEDLSQLYLLSSPNWIWNHRKYWENKKQETIKSLKFFLSRGIFHFLLNSLFPSDTKLLLQWNIHYSCRNIVKLGQPGKYEGKKYQFWSPCNKMHSTSNLRSKLEQNINAIKRHPVPFCSEEELL